MCIRDRLTPNLAGLAEVKEGIRAGQQASVYIKNIIPSRMKVKLIIIDTFDYDYRPAPPQYFIEGNHIDHFTYSCLLYTSLFLYEPKWWCYILNVVIYHTSRFNA